MPLILKQNMADSRSKDSTTDCTWQPLLRKLKRSFCLVFRKKWRHALSKFAGCCIIYLPYGNNNGFCHFHSETILAKWFNKLFQVQDCFQVCVSRERRKILIRLQKFIENVELAQIFEILSAHMQISHFLYLCLYLGLPQKTSCVGFSI